MQTPTTHPPQEEIALYVDALVSDQQDRVPAELLEHVEECVECKLELMDLIDLIDFIPAQESLSAMKSLKV